MAIQMEQRREARKEQPWEIEWVGEMVLPSSTEVLGLMLDALMAAAWGGLRAIAWVQMTEWP